MQKAYKPKQIGDYYAFDQPILGKDVRVGMYIANRSDITIKVTGIGRGGIGVTFFGKGSESYGAFWDEPINHCGIYLVPKLLGMLRVGE